MADLNLRARGNGVSGPDARAAVIGLTNEPLLSGLGAVAAGARRIDDRPYAYCGKRFEKGVL